MPKKICPICKKEYLHFVKSMVRFEEVVRKEYACTKCSKDTPLHVFHFIRTDHTVLATDEWVRGILTLDGVFMREGSV